MPVVHNLSIVVGISNPSNDLYIGSSSLGPPNGSTSLNAQVTAQFAPNNFPMGSYSIQPSTPDSTYTITTPTPTVFLGTSSTTLIFPTSVNPIAPTTTLPSPVNITITITYTGGGGRP